MRRDPTLPIAIVGSALFGLAVGAALGVLFAPAKGVRTRRQLARRAEELGERAFEAAEEARDLAVEKARRFG